MAHGGDLILPWKSTCKDAYACAELEDLAVQMTGWTWYPPVSCLAIICSADSSLHVQVVVLQLLLQPPVELLLPLLLPVWALPSHLDFFFPMPAMPA